jgi:hypothetical protein
VTHIPSAKPKFVLGKGEVAVIQLLKSTSTIEDVVNLLLSKRILDAKSTCENAVKTLKDKKLISIKDRKVELTEAGNLQREVFLLTSVIIEQDEGGKT